MHNIVTLTRSALAVYKSFPFLQFHYFLYITKINFKNYETVKYLYMRKSIICKVENSRRSTNWYMVTVVGTIIICFDIQLWQGKVSFYSVYIQASLNILTVYFYEVSILLMDDNIKLSEIWQFAHNPVIAHCLQYYFSCCWHSGKKER